MSQIISGQCTCSDPACQPSYQNYGHHNHHTDRSSFRWDTKNKSRASVFNTKTSMGTKGCQNECVLFPRRKPVGLVGHYQWHFWQSAHWRPYGSVFLPSTYASIAFWHCMCSPIRDMKHECQMAENKSWDCPTLPQNLPAHLPLLMLPNLTPNPPVIHRWFNQSCSDRSCDWTSTRNGRHCEKVATIPRTHHGSQGPVLSTSTKFHMLRRGHETRTMNSTVASPPPC